MTQTSTSIEARIATLPISAAECKSALAYVNAGESLAEILLVLARFFSTHPSPMLSHNH